MGKQAINDETTDTAISQCLSREFEMNATLNATTSIESNNVSAVTQSVLVPIYTVPTPTPAGTYALEKRARSTQQNPVDASNRYRVAFVPEQPLLIAQDGVSSKFAALVQARIHDIAQERFAALLAEEGMSLQALEPRMFTVDALLSYWAEERDRSRITKESLLAWFDSSATAASLSEKGRQLWRTRLPGILAPMYRNAFTSNEATQIVAKLADADMGDPHAVMLANRLQIIIAGSGIEAEF